MAQPELALVADIGGTNARFALTDPAAASAQLQHPLTLPCAEFASLQRAAEHYLTTVNQHPRHAAIAVACPVGSDLIRMTNRDWSFSAEELRRRLQLERLRMLNDFGAVAWAVPALGNADVERLHGDPAVVRQGPISIVGPGTGLGVALLLGDSARGWQVVETEGGHVSFAPQDDVERRIEHWTRARFGRTSTERLLCGAGLSHIDAALAGSKRSGDDELRDPAAIVEAALAGRESRASEALARFCAILGSVAGDAALIHGARSLMIAGGIVPRFIPFLRGSAFRERFLAKGRFAAMLEKVSIEVITHPGPGLLGAAMALRG